MTKTQLSLGGGVQRRLSALSICAVLRALRPANRGDCRAHMPEIIAAQPSTQLNH